MALDGTVPVVVLPQLPVTRRVQVLQAEGARKSAVFVRVRGRVLQPAAPDVLTAEDRKHLGRTVACGKDCGCTGSTLG